MQTKLSLLITLLSIGLNSGPGLMQAARAETPEVMTQTLLVSGQLLDADTGAPIEKAYIRQHDALNAVFSDTNGFFTLTLDTRFAKKVVFQAEGYEPITMSFQNSQEQLKVNLQPLKHYSSQLPASHQPEPTLSESKIFGPQFNAFYQMNYTLFRQDSVAINGLVLNEFGLSTDLMPLYPLIFRGRFFRSRLPVDVANFPFTPAFYINHLQAKVGAGWIHEVQGPYEWYLGADVMLDNRSPDNRNPQDQQPVAFTGSLLDREQTRLGLGVNGALGWKINDNVTLFPEATVYPLMLNFVSGASPQYTLAGDLGAKLRYQFMPGVYATGAYYSQLWYGFGANALENNHFLQFGVSIDPWTLSEKLK